MNKVKSWVVVAAVLMGSQVVWAAEEPRWSQTTVNAAKTPEEQAVLKQGKSVTVSGEIVDVSCYLQLGKKGQGHVACGSGCIRNGQQIGLLTEKNELVLLFPEEHDPRRGGLVSIREYYADHVGQQATVTGLLVENHGIRALFVAGAPLTPPASAGSAS